MDHYLIKKSYFIIFLPKVNLFLLGADAPAQDLSYAYISP